MGEKKFRCRLSMRRRWRFPRAHREEVREAQESGGAPQPASKPEPYIIFDHVSKSFGDLHVLDDVSFEVLTGETFPPGAAQDAQRSPRSNTSKAHIIQHMQIAERLET